MQKENEIGSSKIYQIQTQMKDQFKAMYKHQYKIQAAIGMGMFLGFVVGPMWMEFLIGWRSKKFIGI